MKAYDFTAGNPPTPFSTADTSAPEINYYWMTSGDAQNGDPLTVDVPLKRSDGKELAYVRGQALYAVAKPAVSTYGPSSYQATPLLVPAADPDTLSQGPEMGYGMTYLFTLQAPPGGDGHFAGVQTVQRQISYVPDDGAYDHGTPGNSVQLDTCPLYSAASSVAAGETKSWPLVAPLGDTPQVTIGRASVSPLTDVRIQDYFNTYLMYRPTMTSRRSAIWVPLGNMQWQWASRAYRNSTNDPWSIGDVPGGNPSYTFVPFAGDSAQVPLFTGTYAPQQQPCPPIPGN
ncbi:MAG: hypothetical protein M3N49_11115 [Candidatus Eremiobacteraeota bacterium]|nr:hypothetical protein [Candidatus Eremiobacteraeota bacterium]